MTPSRSTMRMLSRLTPRCRIRPATERPAAPAPVMTTLQSESLRPVTSQALIRPAEAMMAVPCWSSWKTGMSSFERSSLSMMKHSGDLMSSRLMPPKVPPIARTQSMNFCGSSSSTSMSIESTSANRLKRTDLPSMTGLDAIGPRSPRPRIAVPLVMTATILPFDV